MDTRHSRNIGGRRIGAPPGRVTAVGRLITSASGIAGGTPARLDDLEARAEYDAAMDILARLTAGATRAIEAEQLKPNPDYAEVYRWDAVAQVSSQRLQDLRPADRATVALILQGGGALARSLSADTP